MRKERTLGKVNLFIVICLLITGNHAARAQSLGSNGTKNSINILEALQLINSPEPTFQPNQYQGMDPTYSANLGFEQTYSNAQQLFSMHDGKKFLVSKYSHDETFVIDGATHNGIRHHQEAMQQIRK